ncbi:quinon protein alcohol dehydrogenase-like superfamily [Aspergillus pseudoustus]|uniref:Mitochondrial division protein 1 n=1 Tax=Aspergillus pseudoustus TaxID=1810923 RepID=A0ABR4IKQ3_9EURO
MAYDNDQIYFWNTITGKQLRTVSSNGETFITIRFGPHNNILAAGTTRGTIYIWDTSLLLGPPGLDENNDEILSVGFRPDGKILVSGGSHRHISLWDTTTDQRLQTLLISNDAKHIIFNSDGNMLIATGSRTTSIWAAGSSNNLLIPASSNFSRNSVELSPNGKMVVPHAGTLWVRDPKSGILLHDLEGGGLTAAAFSSDSKVLASGSDKGFIRLWNADTGQNMRELKGHVALVRVVTFRSDGKILASGSDDRTVCLWDIATGACLATLENTHRVIDPSFRPHSKMLASRSLDTIYVWNSATGQCLQSISAPIRLNGKIQWGMSFSRKHPYLDTGLGRIRFTANIIDDLKPGEELPHCLYVSDSWITQHAKNFLWIPPEFRAITAVAVHDNTVALGYHSGLLINLVF